MAVVLEGEVDDRMSPQIDPPDGCGRKPAQPEEMLEALGDLTATARVKPEVCVTNDIETALASHSPNAGPVVPDMDSPEPVDDQWRQRDVCRLAGDLDEVMPVSHVGAVVVDE